MAELKRSKNILMLMWVLCVMTELIFGGVLIFFIVKLVKEEYKSFENPTSQLIGYIVCLCFIIIYFVFILALAIYLTKDTIKQIDVYSESKMCRKKGDKIIFEIEYSNIETIKRSYFNLLVILCRDTFILKGRQKGLKTFMEYYSSKDINKVLQIVSKYKDSTEQETK